MKKALLFFFILSLFIAFQVFAANTITPSSGKGRTIHISAMDSDYDAQKSFKIYSVVFNPGAVNDVLVLRDGSATGAPFAYLESTDGEPRVWYGMGAMKHIYIDYDECTIGAGGSVIINKEL